jgi:hypothetical protein
MIERVTRHFQELERRFATFETFAQQAYTDLNFGGALDPHPSREMRHSAFSVLHCSATLLLNELSHPVEAPYDAKFEPAIRLCLLCLHPVIDLRIATRSLFWAGLVFVKLKYQWGKIIFA